MKPAVRHTFVNLSVAGLSAAVIAASWAGIVSGAAAATGDQAAAVFASPKEAEPRFRWPIDFDDDDDGHEEDDDNHVRSVEAPAPRTTPAPSAVAPTAVAPPVVAPQSIVPSTLPPPVTVVTPAAPSTPASAVAPPVAPAPVPALVPAPKATVAPAAPAPARRRSRAS